MTSGMTSAVYPMLYISLNPICMVLFEMNFELVKMQIIRKNEWYVLMSTYMNMYANSVSALINVLQVPAALSPNKYMDVE